MSMPLICQGCGEKFIWTDEEQKEFAENVSKDVEDEATGDILDVEPYCKMCRSKQDGMRS
jgi:DNA-directed RNA polymerase subunit N (RpoN/RPB10)